MSGCQVSDIQFIGTLEHFLKFQISVEFQAGIGCEASFICLYKRIHDMASKVCFEIKDKIGHIQPVCYTSGIFYIRKGTAGALAIYADFIGIKQLHRGTDAGKALLLEQKSGNRTIYAAAHAN